MPGLLPWPRLLYVGSWVRTFRAPEVPDGADICGVYTIDEIEGTSRKGDVLEDFSHLLCLSVLASTFTSTRIWNSE